MQGFDSSSLALCLVGQHAVEQVLLPTTLYAHCQIRDSIVVSISACHAEDPGSIPGGGVLMSHMSGDLMAQFFCCKFVCELDWSGAQKFSNYTHVEKMIIEDC